MNMRSAIFQAIVLAILLAGCTAQVPMPDLNYPVNAVKRDATVTVVIDRDTLNHQFEIGSNLYKSRFQTGMLLKLVAETELSPMFTRYTFETGYHEPGRSGTDITLVLKLKEYQLHGVHTKDSIALVPEAGYIVLATAYNRDGTRLFNNVYVGKALHQLSYWSLSNSEAKIIRDPSLEALKQIFGKLRVDLDKVLTVTRSR